jgi:3-oxoacyl-[acyl-carrier-protein] synthase-1
MTHSNRVFITGRSALTATGATADSTWDALLQGQSGIDTIAQWDMSNLPYTLGAELKDFQPAKMLPDRKLIKVVSKQDVMGINAAVQAVEHSEMIPYRDSLECSENFNEQTAVYVGSPGNKYFQQYDFLGLLAKSKGDMQTFANQLFDNVNPMWLLRILPNNVLAYTGITYGFKGPNHNVTNHAVSGTQALIEAYHAIKTGKAERAVVVAYDMGMEPQGLYYYDKLGVISQKHIKPFDAERDGTILGEGAAAIVLESEASVQARNATCYGEIVGGLSGSEASGLFSIEAEGQHLSQLLTATLAKCEMTTQDIDLIVAHGNGNGKSDDSEAQALQHVFGETTPPITAFKWSIGHTLCASGLLDTVLASYALNQKCVPGIANFQQAAPQAQGLNIAAATRLLDHAQSALIINRGFASMNACLVIKACV